MRRKLNMERIRFAAEIDNNSVEKFWELLVGNDFFKTLPTFKKRIDKDNGFVVVLKHHKLSVDFDDFEPYRIVSGKALERPFHIEFSVTLTQRATTKYAVFSAELTGVAEKVPLCRKTFAEKFDEYVERLLSQLTKFENSHPIFS